MITGVIGIVGVVIGTGLSSWLSHISHRRSERLRQRAAIRLVASDLYKTRALIASVRETGKWSAEKTNLPTQAYLDHALVLAEHLSPTMWKRLEGSILGVQHLELIRAETQDLGRELTPEDLKNIKRIGAFIDETLSKFDDEHWAIDRSDGFKDGKNHSAMD